jgi:hypothetical protein
MELFCSHKTLRLCGLGQAGMKGGRAAPMRSSGCLRLISHTQPWVLLWLNTMCQGTKSVDCSSVSMGDYIKHHMVYKRCVGSPVDPWGVLAVVCRCQGCFFALGFDCYVDNTL